MENKNSYFIAGASFLIASILLVGFVLFMSATHNDFEEEYFVHTSTLPTGLRKNSSVLCSGIPAGTIQDIYFVDANQSTIEIKIALRKTALVSKDSNVQVITQLLGNTSTLNITRGSGKPFVAGQKRVIELEADSFERLETSVFKITQKTEEALDKINKVLGDENSGLMALSSRMGNEENALSLSKSLKNIEEFSGALKKFDVVAFNNDLKSLSASLKSTSSSVNALSSELLARVKNGEFDFKGVLENSISELSVTTKALRKTLGVIDGAFFRLEENPYEFFFNDYENKELK